MIKFLILFVLVIRVGAVECNENGKISSGWLNGKVITYDNNRKEIPIIGTEIRIKYNDGKIPSSSEKPIKTKTDEEGFFRLSIKRPMILGKKIKITIEGGKNYFILSPYNGEMYPPECLQSYELKVLVISNDSVVQTGNFYAHFANKDKNRINQKQGYTIQVLATHDWNQAVRVEFLFKNQNSFKDCKNEDNICRVYVSFYKNRKDAISLKNRIKRDFRSKHLYQDIFVRSILH